MARRSVHDLLGSLFFTIVCAMPAASTAMSGEAITARFCAPTADAVGDGLLDGFELAHGFAPQTASDELLDPDSDDDGFTKEVEIALGFERRAPGAAPPSVGTGVPIPKQPSPSPQPSTASRHWRSQNCTIGSLVPTQNVRPRAVSPCCVSIAAGRSSCSKARWPSSTFGISSSRFDSSK